MDWIFGTMDGYIAGGGMDGYINAKKLAANSAKDQQRLGARKNA